MKGHKLWHNQTKPIFIYNFYLENILIKWLGKINMILKPLYSHFNSHQRQTCVVASIWRFSPFSRIVKSSITLKTAYLLWLLLNGIIFYATTCKSRYLCRLFIENCGNIICSFLHWDLKCCKSFWYYCFI